MHWYPHPHIHHLSYTRFPMFLAWNRNIACPEPKVVARHVVASMHVCYLPAYHMHPSINLESRHLLTSQYFFEADAIPECIA
jgi:hypothetical protein